MSGIAEIGTVIAVDTGTGIALGTLCIALAVLVVGSFDRQRRRIRDTLQDHEGRLAACEKARIELGEDNSRLRDENYRLYRENERLRVEGRIGQ